MRNIFFVLFFGMTLGQLVGCEDTQRLIDNISEAGVYPGLDMGTPLDVPSNSDVDAVDSEADAEVDASCVIAEELCDGLDNDCNDVIDDIPGDKSCNTGLINEACAIGAVTMCVPGPDGTPVDYCYFEPLTVDEYNYPIIDGCDGIDNDCDGEVDEDIDPMYCVNGEEICYDESHPSYTLMQARCDMDPEQAQHRVGLCAEGRKNCFDPGVSSGFVCEWAAFPGDILERCNGNDDDCDGVIDGTTLPGRPPVSSTIIDGIDGDNEVFVGMTCDVKGVHGICKEGALVCGTIFIDGEEIFSLLCEQVNSQGFEICDNNLDDDCDGDIDETSANNPCIPNENPPIPDAAVVDLGVVDAQVPDAIVDAGVPDAAPPIDATLDIMENDFAVTGDVVLPSDVTVDAEIDAVVDAEIDASPDVMENDFAVTDVAVDAVVDAEIDSAPDVAVDAEIDAIVDAEIDVEVDAEIQCVPSNGGVEICDSIDNNCNDDVVDDEPCDEVVARSWNNYHHNNQLVVDYTKDGRLEVTWVGNHLAQPDQDNLDVNPEGNAYPSYGVVAVRVRDFMADLSDSNHPYYNDYRPVIIEYKDYNEVTGVYNPEGDTHIRSYVRYYSDVDYRNAFVTETVSPYGGKVYYTVGISVDKVTSVDEDSLWVSPFVSGHRRNLVRIVVLKIPGDTTTYERHHIYNNDQVTYTYRSETLVHTMYFDGQFWRTESAVGVYDDDQVPPDIGFYVGSPGEYDYNPYGINPVYLSLP
ncbi:hypothetical protein KKG82_02100 [Patescibacteria group bacterium]|nr:hypothetical protein [Patescibacteria group bacterium]